MKKLYNILMYTLFIYTYQMLIERYLTLMSCDRDLFLLNVSFLEFFFPFDTLVDDLILMMGLGEPVKIIPVTL